MCRGCVRQRGGRPTALRTRLQVQGEARRFSGAVSQILVLCCQSLRNKDMGSQQHFQLVYSFTTVLIFSPHSLCRIL